MSDRSGETTAARLPRNRSRLYAKNWPVIPDHSSKPICTLLPTKISRVANSRALLLPSRANKPNLAHHHKVPHRQVPLALNRLSLDRHSERKRQSGPDEVRDLSSALGSFHFLRMTKNLK